MSPRSHPPICAIFNYRGISNETTWRIGLPYIVRRDGGFAAGIMAVKTPNVDGSHKAHRSVPTLFLWEFSSQLLYDVGYVKNAPPRTLDLIEEALREMIGIMELKIVMHEKIRVRKSEGENDLITLPSSGVLLTMGKSLPTAKTGRNSPICLPSQNARRHGRAQGQDGRRLCRLSGTRAAFFFASHGGRHSCGVEGEGGDRSSGGSGGLVNRAPTCWSFFCIWYC